MNNLCLCFALFVLFLAHGQNKELDPNVLREEKITVSKIISLFSTLDGLYFDGTIEQHIYTQLSGLNYLKIQNEPKSILLHQSFLDSKGEWHDTNTYCTANLFAEKRLFKDALDARISGIEVDTTMCLKEDRKTYNYHFNVAMQIEKDGIARTIHFLFFISSGRIVMVHVLER